MARQASRGVAERPNLEKHQAVPSTRLLEAPRNQNHRLAEPCVHLIANRPGRQRRPSDGDKDLGDGKFETEWSATGRDEHRSKVCKSALQSHCGGRQISRGCFDRIGRVYVRERRRSRCVSFAKVFPRARQCHARTPPQFLLAAAAAAAR